MALPPILVELKANSREFVTGMKEAQHEVQKLGTGSSAHMQKFAAVGKAALFGIAGLATVVGAGSLEMADKFEKSHAKIEAALKGAGTSIDVWGSQIKNADKHMEQLGFTNSDTENALAQLTIALGDPNKALQVLSTSADLARTKNIDLATAGTMVARAMEGNARALKQMGIDLPINAKSAEGLKVAQNNLRFATEAYQTQLTRIHEKHKVTAADLATLKTAHDRLKFAQDQVNQAQHAGTLILDALNQRLGGQSQQYAETFAGKVTVLKTQIEDLGVKIGLALIPVLEKAATITANVVNWFEKHAAVAKLLGIVLGTVLVVAIGAYVVSMVVAAAATIAATWPILAVISAIGLLVVGVYELVTHWHTVWTDISSFVKRHSLLIAAAMVFLLGPIGMVAGAALLLWTHWQTVWGGIKSVTTTVAHGVTGAFSDIVNAGRDLVAWIADKLLGAFGMIVHGAADAFGWVPGIGGKLRGAAREFDTFRDQVNYALDGIHKNVMINVDAHISAAANKALHAAAPGTIGHAYAKGTNYAAGGLSLVGENGPELMDVPRGARIYPHGTAPGGSDDLLRQQLDESRKQTAALQGLAADLMQAVMSPQGAKAMRDAMTRLARGGTTLGLTG